MMDEPRFDEVVTLVLEGEKRGELVVHRDVSGAVASWHSPLDDGAIRCSICEGGARVYLSDRVIGEA